MLKPGSIAPAFTLPDDSGTPTSLADLLAQGPLILYFYPADFTPICTAEACTFRDAASELSAAGVRVVGISAQSVESKARFKAKHKLNFRLLADTDGVVTRQFGAKGMFGFLPFGTRRVTYLINADGTILDAHANELSASSHHAFVQRALRTLSELPKR
jgi:thioredoxin-dependent peroxiredoxin